MVYKTNQKIDDELLIIEIIENGYTNNDFVLFYFSNKIFDDKNKIKKIETKIAEYRKQKSVCIFAVCKESVLSNDFSFIQNQFDLFFTNITNQLFDDLINACYGTRGMIHGDPADWLPFSKNCKHNILSKEGKSLNEIAKSIINDIKNSYVIENNAQIENIMCSIQGPAPEDIPTCEIQSFFEELAKEFTDINILWNLYQTEAANTKVVVVW